MDFKKKYSEVVYGCPRVAHILSIARSSETAENLRARMLSRFIVFRSRQSRECRLVGEETAYCQGYCQGNRQGRHQQRCDVLILKANNVDNVTPKSDAREVELEVQCRNPRRSETGDEEDVPSYFLRNLYATFVVCVR